jgi:hypothetical protein
VGAVRVHTLVVEPGAEVEIHWQYAGAVPTLTRRYTAPPTIVAEVEAGQRLAFFAKTEITTKIDEVDAGRFGVIDNVVDVKGRS